MSLGERIYKLRKEKNLSQGDLADMLGVSRQSISKWENNSAVPGGGLGGLVFASPFLICGILCFVLKKNVGLWCAWVV